MAHRVSLRYYSSNLSSNLLDTRSLARSRPQLNIYFANNLFICPVDIHVVSTVWHRTPSPTPLERRATAFIRHLPLGAHTQFAEISRKKTKLLRQQRIDLLYGTSTLDFPAPVRSSQFPVPSPQSIHSTMRLLCTPGRRCRR